MRQRLGAAFPVLLFTAVVLGLTLLLLRAQPASEAEAVVHPATSSGDETSQRLTPVLRPARLPASGASRVRVALVRDPASVRYYDDSARYDRSLQLWSATLERVGATVAMVSPADLARDSSDVVVVAAAPCLSPATRDAMLGAATRARGVIFTGLTGTRDAGCRSIGFGLVASLIRAGRADTLSSTMQPFVTVPAMSPLSLDVPPGSRVELLPAPHVAVRHAGRDAYYSDRDLNPAALGESFIDGAVVHDLTDGRRAAYFGFELETVVDAAWERGIIDLLVRNAVALAAGVAVASPDPWPSGFAAAAVIAQDVEDEFRHARHAIDSLEAAGATGTFFLVSDIAQGHPTLVREMHALGEIGTHSENHVAFGGPTRAQRRRLDRTQGQLAALIGEPIHGLRPPEERFDERTLSAWRQAGGTYVFGATNGRSASPEMIDVEGAPFVLIGRTADDDFLTVRRAGITDPSRLATDQLAAFAKSKALGGLYIMSYHSNMMARPVTAPAIGAVARALRAEPSVWLTTMVEVADWWRARHSTQVAIAHDGAGTMTLSVRNGPTEALLPSSVTILLPRDAHVAGTSGPPLLPSAPGTARIDVPSLAPNAVYSVNLTTRGGGHAN